MIDSSWYASIVPVFVGVSKRGGGRRCSVRGCEVRLLCFSISTLFRAKSLFDTNESEIVLGTKKEH